MGGALEQLEVTSCQLKLQLKTYNLQLTQQPGLKKDV